MKSIRCRFLDLIKPLVRLVGKIHTPYSHKCLKSLHYKKICRAIRPGDVLVSRTSGELTTLLIPGTFKHAAIYIGQEEIVEAVGEGVRVSTLMDFVFTKDKIAICSPIFLDADQRADAVVAALAQVGKPYDYDFDPGCDAFFCAELPLYCFITAKGGADCMPEFTTREILGTQTVIPDDYTLALSAFGQVLRVP